ncbi:MAG: sugar transferase [Actinomycetia bacterium]|nr:sugar transferase [Actinomycetes bacterium]
MSYVRSRGSTVSRWEKTVGDHLKSSKLKVILITGDAFAFALGYVLILNFADFPTTHGWPRSVAVVAAAVAIGLLAVRSQGLFLARVSAVRIVELTRSTRAIGIAIAGLIIFDRITKIGFRIRYIIGGALLAWLFFVVLRSVFRGWVATKRAKGLHQRQVIVIGADDEAARLIELFATHADLGMAVVGIVGNRGEAVRHNMGALWLGEVDRAEELVATHRVSGVVVSPTALGPTRLHELIRNLQRLDLHVHLATGVSGIDARRLRRLSLSHEPLLYVEAPPLSRIQLALKRGFDVVAAAVLLVAAAPLLGIIALAIHLGDKGPIVFRQQRVGRGGATFDVLKFRTMSVDAEARLAALKANNERNGPLFKMEHDPRVTRVGRLLRETSLDELPQLVNVLRGEMSLVGPRPALPSEVATFAPELREREQVRPGITGLWQTEARDNPSFETYRRLDLFYVENWSVTLDLMILLGTIEHLAVRFFGAFRRRPEKQVRAEVQPGALAVEPKRVALAESAA